MRRCLVLALLVTALALTGVARSTPAGAPAVTVAGQSLVVEGRPYFPIFTWAACPEDIDPALAAGVTVFMAHGECSTEAAFLAELGQRAYYVPLSDSRGDFTSDPRLLGWSHPDEPDGHGIPPDQLSQAPGRFTFLTLTAHFADGQASLSSDLGKSVYKDYIAKASAVGFDVYPLAQGCGREWVSLGLVYTYQRELAALAGGRPTFQWLETTGQEGRCGSPVTPQSVRAEAWLAIAGGARGLGWFTYTWPAGRPRSFSVEPEIASAMAAVNARIQALAPIVLAPSLPRFVSRRADPIKLGARSYGGRTYLFVVNSFDVPMRWSRGSLPGLKGQRVTVVGEGRSLRAREGRLADAFDPLGVHIYSYVPR